MDWFRWWHGTVTDPKFQWVARKSGQPVGSVIAVWAALLECASTATQGNADATRGNVASFDCNDYDVALGFEDGTVQAIFAAMEQKGLIADRCIAKWNERQPKREDSGNPNTGALSSTERSRLRREKLKREATDATAMQRNATHGNGREEESREEEKEITPSAPSEKISLDAGGEWIGIPAALTAKWQEAYPAISLGAELSKASAWILANPKNKKSNYARFLTNWLCRAQDNAPKRGGNDDDQKPRLAL